MSKRVLCILLLLLILPVFAGEYQKAFKNKDVNYIFLYMYTRDCGYCKEFSPIYEKLKQKYSDRVKFVKVDAYSFEGQTLSRNYKANYVPFGLFIDKQQNNGYQMSVSCMLQYSCAVKAMDERLN